MRISTLSKEQFNHLITQINGSSSFNEKNLFELYSETIEGAESVLESNILKRDVPIDHVTLILYLIHEYAHTINIKKMSEDELINNDEICMKIVNLSLDKYFTNEHMDFKKSLYISRFSPRVSCISTYLNFALEFLSRFNKRNPYETLIIDTLSKSFSTCKSILTMLCSGFETEAFSTWRTLHETECILKLLVKYGTSTVNAYLKHLDYGLAFRGLIQPKEKVDEIFVKIKKEMADLNLKSKDMKKFIEYGWLSSIPGVFEQEKFQFNFRDGIQKTAGLSVYSKVYELASEIAHSSPLLIYSNAGVYTKVTLVNLYESFFRLETIFVSLFDNFSSYEEKERFTAMRNVYLNEIKEIYISEKQNIQQK